MPLRGVGYVDMTELTDRFEAEGELRFAALMLVISVVVLVAIIREARTDADFD